MLSGLSEGQVGVRCESGAAGEEREGDPPGMRREGGSGASLLLSALLAGLAGLRKPPVQALRTWQHSISRKKKKQLQRSLPSDMISAVAEQDAPWQRQSSRDGFSSYGP